MAKTIRVKFRNHFKVAIPFKDSVTFENELNKKGLDFYVDYKLDSFSGSLIEYHILQKDRSAISAFLQDNEIIDNSDALQFAGFSAEPNFMGLYLKFVGAFVTLMTLLKAIDLFINP